VVLVDFDCGVVEMILLRWWETHLEVYLDYVIFVLLLLGLSCLLLLLLQLITEITTRGLDWLKICIRLRLHIVGVFGLIG
jgi:hypothetical protein